MYTLRWFPNSKWYIAANTEHIAFDAEAALIAHASDTRPEGEPAIEKNVEGAKPDTV